MPAPYTSPFWSSCRCSGCCLLNMSVATTHGKLGFCCFVRLLQPGNVFGLQDVDGELWRLQRLWPPGCWWWTLKAATSVASRMLMVNSEGCSSMVSISSAKKRFPRLNLHTAVATAESIRLLPTKTVLGQCAQIMLFKDSLFWVFPCNWF